MVLKEKFFIKKKGGGKLKIIIVNVDLYRQRKNCLL